MATANDSKLSYAELLKLAEEYTALAEGKRESEITAFIDGTIEGAAEIKLSIEDLIKALQARAPKSGPVRGTKRAPSKSGTKVMAERGVTYKNPQTGELYKRSESGKGRIAKWLQDLVDAGGTFEQYKA